MKNKGLSLALLVAGIVLIVWGVAALESFSSDVSRFFTGAPTNKAVWLLTGGIALVCFAGFDLFRFHKAK